MKTTIDRFLKVQEYSAPSIELANMVTEGLLCASGDFNINDWVREEDGSINF